MFVFLSTLSVCICVHLLMSYTLLSLFAVFIRFSVHLIIFFVLDFVSIRSFTSLSICVLVFLSFVTCMCSFWFASRCVLISYLFLCLCLSVYLFAQDIIRAENVTLTGG